MKKFMKLTALLLCIEKKRSNSRTPTRSTILR